MAVVVSEESRAGMRDVYLPGKPIGMAHFSATDIVFYYFELAAPVAS